MSNDIAEGKNPNFKVTKTFYAQVMILTHKTTITSRFNAVIHCKNIVQNAKIILPDGVDTLRSDDKSIVGFEFSFHSELLEIGSTFFFREESNKGIGMIINFDAPENFKKE